jgi:diketogulonate reductase-like aldo/keto reductase
VRSIAVSNFSPTQMACILANATAVVPAVNQMPYSVGHGQDTVVSDNAKHGVVVQVAAILKNEEIKKKKALFPACRV